jgi:CMP-N-acetylneuraminic acid synthetase/spore coat polysaccharide biosynthesis predicted glycosyltransferase SpsG
MSSANILLIIPARGGSKGIPRKNMRLLNGKPLIYYSIKTALASKIDLDVYVSSDDDEILNFASKLKAKTHKRENIFSKDNSTLDPVIYDCYNYAKLKERKSYEYIITLQPTSPLLKTNSLDNAIKNIFQNKNVDTIISAKENTHLSWKFEDGKFQPNYTERLNRQYLTPTYKETGAFLITRKENLSINNRIGGEVFLYSLSDGEQIDIDTYEDWSLCEYYLNRKQILFVVTGNSKVGLGHVYNTLLIANDILNHQITFLVDIQSKMAYDKILENNYPVHLQSQEDIVDDIIKINPDLVINDILDTSNKYIKRLKSENYKIINFEDLGQGAKEADLVINAIYPENQKKSNHFYGHNYFILRDEFIHSEFKQIKESVNNVLLTFGGVDPNNYTLKVLSTIYDFCKEKEITINIIAGFGYEKYESLKKFTGINIYKNISNISKYILEADIIFTSAGRTTYEIASIGTPAIVLEQNSREQKHFFAKSAYGFLNVGLGYKINTDELMKVFLNIVESSKKRINMNQKMKKVNLKNGRKRVIELIQNITN